MGDFDLINFMMIDDVNRSTKNQQLLTDLQGKAAYLHKKTGQEPLSWYEFSQIQPKEEARTFGSLAKGVMVGAAIGAVVGLFMPLALPLTIAAGGFFGGVVGVFGDTETVRRDKQVKGYDNYLREFERDTAMGRAPAPEPTPPAREGVNVEKLRQQQQNAQIAATTSTLGIL